MSIEAMKGNEVSDDRGTTKYLSESNCAVLRCGLNNMLGLSTDNFQFPIYFKNFFHENYVSNIFKLHQQKKTLTLCDLFS